MLGFGDQSEFFHLDEGLFAALAFDIHVAVVSLESYKDRSYNHRVDVALEDK